MTGYVSCCCRAEAVGWRIQVRNRLTIQATETIYFAGGLVRTIETNFTNIIAIECERSLLQLRIFDIGSSLSGSRNQTDSNGFFDRRTFSDYLDLNDDTGQTHSNGDPIYRTAADFPSTLPLQVAQYPPGFINTDCIAGPDTEKVARRDASEWPSDTPFEQQLGATYTITREVEPDPFGTFSGVFEERRNPVGVGAILWDTRNGSGGFAGFDVGLGAQRVYEMIGDFPVDNITALNDLGMGTGIIIPNPLFDITNTAIFPDFVCLIDGNSISREEISTQADSYRCSAAQGLEVFHRYSLINQVTGTLDREFEVTALRDQEIISLDPVFS